MNIFGTQFDYQRRMEKIRKKMAEHSLDAILINSSVNQYYISGMFQHAPWYPVEVIDNTETPLVIFQDKSKDPVFLITYLTGNGTKEGTWIKDVRFLDREPYGKKPWYEYLADILKEKGVDQGTIGIEREVLVLTTFDKIKSALPKAQFKAADEIFQTLRTVKDADEIQLIKESVLVAEGGLKAGMAAAKPGVLESEVQKAAEIEMKRLGAIREIETMVQSGIRTANHRAFGANWKKIQDNELMMIDIGCVYKGYGSDLTRTWCVGKPTDQWKKIADDLISVREKGVSMLKPGAVLKDIYKMAETEFKKAGYITDKSYLPDNNTGWAIVTVHGIGLGPMHDPPHVFDRNLTLESGMTVAYTSGARFKDFTIRFEDDFVIVPSGAEMLNKGLPWAICSFPT